LVRREHLALFEILAAQHWSASASRTRARPNILASEEATKRLPNAAKHGFRSLRFAPKRYVEN
jgi:hypothetical protein